MEQVTVTMKLKDTFSGATDTRTKTVSRDTFDGMTAHVGRVFIEFDKRSQIRYSWEVLSVTETKN